MVGRDKKWVVVRKDAKGSKVVSERGSATDVARAVASWTATETNGKAKYQPVKAK